MGFGGAGGPDTLSSIGGSLNSLMTMLQAADAAPTGQLEKAVAERREALRALFDKWGSLVGRELDSLNGVLRAAKLEEIALGK
jgi:hypothetical protein